MSNVKRVTLNGTLPFDCDHHPEMQRWLAYLNAPAFGLRIRYSRSARLVPNRDGSNGQTAMYGFCIYGEEAVSWGALDSLKAAIIACGGTVQTNEIKDLEAGD